MRRFLYRGALVETGVRLLPGTAVVLHVLADERTIAVRARVVRCHVCAILKDAGVRYQGALAFADPTTTPPINHADV